MSESGSNIAQGSRPGGSHKVGRLTVEVVRSLDRLEAFASQWDNLAFDAPQQLPILSHAWISAYYRHRLCQSETICCLVASAESEMVGVLPLIASPRRLAGFQHQWLRTPFDDHTASVDALAPPGMAAEVIAAFISALNEFVPGWYGIEFRRLHGSSPLLSESGPSLPRIASVRGEAGVGAYLPTNGEFEIFRTGLSKNFRSNLNKAANKLARLKDVHFEFQASDDARPDALLRFMEVEALSWKGQEGTAIASSEDLVDFYKTAVEHLSRRGLLEWHFLSAEGKTIAGNLGIKSRRSLIIWKLGYDQAYSKMGPGTLLFEQVVKRAFESPDVEEINLMTDMPWYDNWCMKKRDYYDLYLHPRRPLVLLTAVLPRKCRQILRKITVLRRIVKQARRLAGTDAA